MAIYLSARTCAPDSPTFAMLFGELDGIRCHSWRLWRSAHVWESYRTALFNGGLLGESIWKSTNQSLAPSHITQNPVTRNRLYGWMRTLGSICSAHTTHFVAPMPCTAGSSLYFPDERWVMDKRDETDRRIVKTQVFDQK